MIKGQVFIHKKKKAVNLPDQFLHLEVKYAANSSHADGKLVLAETFPFLPLFGCIAVIWVMQWHLVGKTHITQQLLYISLTAAIYFHAVLKLPGTAQLHH